MLQEYPPKIKTTLTAAQIKYYTYYYNLALTIVLDELDAVESVFIPFVGIRGSGKSTCAIKLALDIDPKFSAAQIGFTKLEMLDIIESLAYIGERRVAIMDEFGAEMMARNWYEETQKILVAVLQAIRETHVSLFVCLPHLRFADYVAEALGNFCFEVYRPAHIRTPYRIAKMLEIYGFKSTRDRAKFKPIWLDGEIFHPPFINPIPTHEELFDEYLAKKRVYIQALIEKSRQGDAEQGLTKRQSEYLKLFQQGRSETDIADLLNVTKRQVRRMRKELADKEYRVEYIPP